MGRDLGVVTVADVAHEGVLAIELMPREREPRIGHGVVNLATTFARDMRVLSSPNHEHLGFDFGRTIKRAIVPSFSERTLSKVGAVEAGAGRDFRLSDTSAKAEVTTETNTKCSDFTGAGFMVCLLYTSDAADE